MVLYGEDPIHAYEKCMGFIIKLIISVSRCQNINSINCPYIKKAIGASLFYIYILLLKVKYLLLSTRLKRLF